MVRRDVQGIEVGPLQLDLGALRHLVAHPDEQVGDALHQRGDRVTGAARPPVARQRHVDRFLHQHAAGPLLLQGGQPGVVRLLDRRPGLVDPPTRVGPGLRRQRADLPPRQGHRRPVAQVLVTQRDQTVHVGRRGERLPRRRHRLVQRRLVQQRDLLGVVHIAAPAHDRPRRASVADGSRPVPAAAGPEAGPRWGASYGVARFGC